MVDTNEVTGARLTTKPPTKEYEAGWDRIFGKNLKDSKEVQEAQCSHWIDDGGKIDD